MTAVRHLGTESKFHKTIDVATLDRRQKMKIAESAVLFRLCCYGFNTFRPAFDGDRVDWVVQTDEARLLKLQVKWVKNVGKYGLPIISLICIDGNVSRRYRQADFDFIVGYDFFDDTAYVFTYAETAHCKSAIAIAPGAAERWDKLLPK